MNLEELKNLKKEDVLPLSPEQLKEEEKKEQTKTSEFLIKQLIERIDKQAEKINILEAIADRKALAAYNARHKKTIESTISIRAMDIFDEKLKEMKQKVILAWRTVKNDVYQDPATQRWRENQQIELFYEDGTKQTMPLLNFYRNYKKISCKKVGQIEDKGEMSLKLVRSDTGKELIIGVSFVN